jgi:hypothetical protein
MSGDDLICAPCAPIFYVHQICPLSSFQIWFWLYAAAPATGRGKRPATPRAPRNRVVVSSKTSPEISIHSVRVISGSVAGLLRSEEMSVPAPHPSHSGVATGKEACHVWAVASRTRLQAASLHCTVTVRMGFLSV